MAIGPCLCGDPHCSSCGDSSLAAWEAAIETLTDKIEHAKLSEEELMLFEAVGFAAVKAHRDAMDSFAAHSKQLQEEVISASGMDELVFRKREAASLFLSLEPERKHYWKGYIKGLESRSVYPGPNAHHLDNLGIYLGRKEPDYEKHEFCQGYSAAYFNGNQSIGTPDCPNCHLPLKFDGLFIGNDAVFACEKCGAVMDFNVVSGKWTI